MSSPVLNDFLNSFNTCECEHSSYICFKVLLKCFYPFYLSRLITVSFVIHKNFILTVYHIRIYCNFIFFFFVLMLFAVKCLSISRKSNLLLLFYELLLLLVIVVLVLVLSLLKTISPS